ncbi:nucleotide exchange factor GrpE [Erysipelotrichaceae bacterium OH741_COT-311]|nr:nucleotide exchange factor GrpE [Erysipelotrichaceae bacterium OH741_COT-311]
MTEVKKEVLEEVKEETCCTNQETTCKCEEQQETVNSQTDLLNRIEELQKENDKLKNEYAKAYADTENTRKRLMSDFELNKKYRIQSFALDILPVIDNLERSLKGPHENVDENYIKGIEMIYHQLIHALSKEGVEEVDTSGEFDANFHQALMVEKVEGVASNQVIEVLQKGYKLKDRILRAAMVKVSE